MDSAPDGLPQRLQHLVAEVHRAPHKVVIEYAGAGSQALAWLHAVEGSSDTLLEATERYAAASLKTSIGFEPAQFTSKHVARLMAHRAYARAQTLCAQGGPVLGVGLSAAIATARAKRGQHRCAVALRDAETTTTTTLVMHKGARTRAAEERLVSSLLVQTLARACGVLAKNRLELEPGEAIEVQRGDRELLPWLLEQDVRWILVSAQGVISAGQTLPHVALLSGAFNPLHAGHRQLVQAASKRLGQEVFFELPLHNADKPPLSAEQVQSRVAQFVGVGTLVLSRAPLFSHKATVFPGSVFVVGADTAERLFQRRFYGDDPAQLRQAFEHIRNERCRFLVAGRRVAGRFLTLDELEVPHSYRDLFEGLPEACFRSELSSSALRERGT